MPGQPKDFRPRYSDLLPRGIGSRTQPPKGMIHFGRFHTDNKYDCALDIEEWEGLKFNQWNFQKLNDALYNTIPINLAIRYPKDYSENENIMRSIHLCLIPLASFHGLQDWPEMRTPNNYVLVVCPGEFSLFLQIFNRHTKVSYSWFRGQGMAYRESRLLEYFLNAVIDPEGRYAQSMERHGRKWRRFARKNK